MMNASASAPFVSPSAPEPALEEQPHAYVLRCKFDQYLYSHVFSSIARSSIAIYGIRFSPNSRGSNAEVIAVLSLPKPVSAEGSLARLEGGELVLVLPKSGDRQEGPCVMLS